MPSAERIFKTTQEQIAIQAARKLEINDDAATRRIIESNNYYKIFNGYKDPFLDKSAKSEEYLEGTKFEEIYALYQFDKKLKNIFIRYILEIENNIKSVIAHVFSCKYGHDNYLKVANFDTSLKAKERKTSAQKVGEIAGLISNIQKEISRQLEKNNPMISHYMLEYGYIPLWVLVNTLTIGTLSKFYSALKQQDQNDVGRFFLLKPDEMICILQVLTLFRNACAHDERLYNLKAMNRNMRPNNICAMPIHASLNIPKNGGNNYTAGVNDLFAVVIIFKTMLTKETFDEFFQSLDELMVELDSELKTIPSTEIETMMGFVPNWRDINSPDENPTTVCNSQHEVDAH